MPRNGLGTYFLPEAPFVAGTVISSAAVNSDLSDIATALTGSFARDGQSTMLGQFKALDGSLLAPGYSFGNEVTTGLRRPAAGQIGVVLQGVQTATFTAAGLISPVLDTTLFTVNLDTVLTPGGYVCNDNTCTNGPTVGGQWYIEVMAYPIQPTNYLMQRATDLIGTGTIWTRVRLAGVWQAWIQATPPATVMPSGSVVLFWQTNAPTGWTKITTQNDKALRVVSGSGGVSGGTNAFSTVMAQTVVGSSTLSTAQLASHGHSYTGAPITGTVASVGCGVTVPTSTGLTTGSAGSGTSHNHTITMSIQYIDIILCSKD